MNKQDKSDRNMNNIEQRTIQNNQHLALWTSLWLVTLALVSFGPKFLWDYHTVISGVLVWLNLAVGYKMIMANKRLLDGLDELQQRIQLEAMALALGCSVVFGAIFGLVAEIKLVAFTPNPSSVLFVVGITYLLGILLARKKYL